MDKFIDLIKNGGIGVMPTDTIYGLVGSAMKPKTVERIFKVRKRDPKKPFLILIPSIKDLENFGVDFTNFDPKLLKKYWPGKVTIILPLTKISISKFKYLHRGENTLAFRLPKKSVLISILKKTGPLVAPSANISGGEPSRNLEEAQNYFGDQVDFYISGRVSKKSSKIIDLSKENVEIIRDR